MAKTLRELGVPTITVAQAKPGDAVFCIGTAFIDRCIQFGQKLRGLGQFKVNHIAWCNVPVFDDQGVVVDWHLGQALAKGITTDQLLSQRGTGVEIVPLEAFPTLLGWDKQFMVDRDIHLATLRSQIGVKYGWLTIASTIVTILTPKWFRLDFRRANTWICSAVYSWALHAGGGLVEGDVYQRMPGDVAQSTIAS